MILRDKSKITKVLILLELLKGRKKLREIAKEIDITVQGVSEYIRTMEREGLVKEGSVTLKGLEFLSDAIEEMGDFVAEANSVMKKVKVIEAIAGEDIDEGEEVGLFMEDGYIHAYRRESSSKGIALNSARKGEDLGVTALQGVLRIDYGKVRVFSLPPIEMGGTRAVNREKLKKVLENRRGEKIGVCGVVAYLAVRDLAKIDFQFSAVNAAVDAHYRGVSTMLFVSQSMLPHALRILEEKGVPYELETL